MMGDITEIRGDGETEIMKDVIALKTPGHTSGHISLIVNSEDKKVLIAGDQTMTRSEYINRTFSRWYPKQNLLDLNKSLDKVQKYKPDLVIPGHDRPFCP